MIRPGDSLPEGQYDGSYDEVMAKLRDGTPITEGEYQKLARMVDHLAAQARMVARENARNEALRGQPTIMGIPVVETGHALRFETNESFFRWLAFVWGTDPSPLPIQPITQIRYFTQFQQQ